MEPSSGTQATSRLMQQNLANLDISKLTPLTPEVISTIGHVAHGKSTVVRAVSGVQTVRFKNEKERNITIKLGDPMCPTPQCYASYGSSKEDNPPCLVPGCGHVMQLQRHISFVDCPGHDILMATMLNGAAALLLIAGNEPCPQPQTSEHLAAVEIMKLKHIIILQNKVELTKDVQAKAQYEQIKEFVADTAAEYAPIIPMSAVLKYNIDVLAEYMTTQIPVPVRDFTCSPQMIVIRSFDPGDSGESVKGGVVGGSILKGVLEVGKDIEIRPGIIRKQPKGFIIRPIRSKIVSLFAEQNDLKYAVPGGLIGVGTNIDPSLTRADRLVGQVLGYPEDLPDILVQLEVRYYLLRRLLGIKSKEGNKASRVKKLDVGEYLMINVGSTSVGGKVKAVKSEKAKIQLVAPVCSQIGDKVALSRRVDKHWRLIGWGEITKGEAGSLTFDWETIDGEINL